MNFIKHFIPLILLGGSAGYYAGKGNWDNATALLFAATLLLIYIVTGSRGKKTVTAATSGTTAATAGATAAPTGAASAPPNKVWEDLRERLTGTQPKVASTAAKAASAVGDLTKKGLAGLGDLTLKLLAWSGKRTVDTVIPFLGKKFLILTSRFGELFIGGFGRYSWATSCFAASALLFTMYVVNKVFDTDLEPEQLKMLVMGSMLLFAAGSWLSVKRLVDKSSTKK